MPTRGLPPNRTQRRDRAGALVGAWALCLYIATAGGSLASTDAVVTYEVAKGLVERGSVALPYDVLGIPESRGIDGRFYSPFGIGQSLYDIPFYLGARLVETTTGLRPGREDMLLKAAVAFGNAFAAAAAVWVTFLFASRLVRRRRHALLAAASLGCASLLWPYSKFGFNTPLATLCLVAATYAAWRGTREQRPALFVAAGAMLGAGILTRHEFMLAAIPIVLWLVLESRREPGRLVPWLLLVGGPLALSMAIWMAYNAVRFGNPLFAGLDPGFGRMADGLAGLLFSPGGSLFVYSPVAAVGIVALVHLWKVDRPTALLFTAPAAILLIFYSSLSNWEGGRSYGSRYLVPLLPFLCISLGRLVEDLRDAIVRRMVACVIVFSGVVQLPGVLVDFSKVAEHDAQRTGLSHVDRTRSWSSAAITLNTQAALAAVPRNIRHFLGREPLPAIKFEGGAAGDAFSRQFAFGFDFWWAYLFYLRLLSAPAALACGISTLALSLVLGLQAWRKGRADVGESPDRRAAP